MAHNIGFFHYFSQHEWKNNVLMAGFEIGRGSSAADEITGKIGKRSSIKQQGHSITKELTKAILNERSGINPDLHINRTYQ